MQNVVGSLVKDALDRVKDPAIQSAIHSNVLAPLFASLLDMLFPYLVAIVGVWAVMLLLLIAILVVLLRRPGVQ